VVVDPDLRVLLWNSKAEDLWGLRADEVQGKNLLNLDIGLPLDRLKPAVRNCLAGGTKFEEVVLDAINRRGKSIACQVRCTTMADRDTVHGAILVMNDNALGAGAPIEATAGPPGEGPTFADGHS